MESKRNQEQWNPDKRGPKGFAAQMGDEASSEPQSPPRPQPAGGEHGMDEAVVREMGYQFVDMIVEYWKGLEGRRVYGPLSPVGLDEMFKESLPEQGAPLAEVLQEVRTRVFPNTMAIGSRRYFGMMNPAPMPVAVFAEALASAMNQNVASWRHAPSGTAIEKRVIRWLCDLFGLPETSFGTFVSGGSLANITALKLAINRALGRHLSQMDRGGPGQDIAKLVFYVSSQGHYSFDKAVDMLGIGRNQLRKIPQDDIFRIDLRFLEESIQADMAAGRKPACIIGIGGSTNTGSIDKLDKLAELARRYDCWFHVDAAYGGAVILSEMYGPMLRGIDQADSITVDPHKWFYMPFSAGGILVRDGDFLRQSFLVHPEYYMEKTSDGAEEPPEDRRGFHLGDKVNFFQYGVQGSRRLNALKLWMAFKMVGRRQYAAWVEKDIELARILAARIRRQDDFQILGPNTLGICNFRWQPQRPGGGSFTPEETDQLNRELQETVENDGDAWFSYTMLNGRVALRVNVENRCMGQSDIERLMTVIRRTADRILTTK
ncbi:hypothetical protein CSA17_03805 [bacterium DOLJORAL78_65_58]|nr:MAG: hypothetical protein CSB20_06525 [bacterium DOLZORAL124_64_63]PIE76136.1 MAG: hypothetical protein CSA17_03805 [bacterium DOLJORAL78_65_58]